MKVVDRGRDFNTRNCFLFDIIFGCTCYTGFSSMPKRDIVENRLIQVWEYVLIIVLSLMSNLLPASKTTA